MLQPGVGLEGRLVLGAPKELWAAADAEMPAWQGEAQLCRQLLQAQPQPLRAQLQRATACGAGLQPQGAQRCTRYPSRGARQTKTHRGRSSMLDWQHRPAKKATPGIPTQAKEVCNMNSTGGSATPTICLTCPAQTVKGWRLRSGRLGLAQTAQHCMKLSGQAVSRLRPLLRAAAAAATLTCPRRQHPMEG